MGYGVQRYWVFPVFNCYIYYFLDTVLPVTIFISLYITFSGYLVSVDSYMNLQVLIWQFGCLTIRSTICCFFFRIAKYLLDMKWHTKLITTSTACSLLTQRNTLIANSLATWERFWSGSLFYPLLWAYAKCCCLVNLGNPDAVILLP